MFASEVKAEIEKLYAGQNDDEAIASVIAQLRLQGVITDVELLTGDRALILRIDVIEQYASSLIAMARGNRRGVPAFEERLIGSTDLKFPGLEPNERLPRSQERTVLESVVQLLLVSGICLRHAGLLIFPSLFTPTNRGSSPEIADSIVMCYDFSGAIDNVYSSLVASLAIGKAFGRMRLWQDAAEFERLATGLCGIRKVNRGGGYAHLDIYFEAKTIQATRDLFVNVIENHLHQYGVDIYESLRVSCLCGYSIEDEIIRKRVHAGKDHVVCPVCEYRTTIAGGRSKRETVIQSWRSGHGH